MFLEGSELLLHVLLDGFHEVLCVQVHALLGAGIAVDADGEILGHVAVVNGVDAGSLKSLAVLGEVIVAIKLGTVSKTTSPGKDGG